MPHASISPLDRYRRVGRPSTPRRQRRPADCLTYFWRLAEAESPDDLDHLCPDLDRRSRELAALARGEDIKITLYHLTRAVEESGLLNQWHKRERRAAILEAISTATVVS
jgi:hypothetical protein